MITRSATSDGNHGIAATLFDLVDRNKDGTLEKKELLRAQKVLINGLASDVHLVPMLDMESLDTDGNGLLPRSPQRQLKKREIFKDLIRAL